MKIKSIIIDDNPFIINLLKDLLQQEHPLIEVSGVAKNGMEGISKIQSIKPDLIFLDVEMPDMTGFDMLNKLEDIQFQTIFITSFSHYAIKAIRFNALDYLLKPIDQKELKNAIRNFRSNFDSKVNQKHLEQALINLKTKKAKDQMLFIPTQQGELRIALKDIIKLEGDSNYSYIHLKNKTKKLCSKTLGYFEEILSEKGFCRCHRSFLVNGLHIDRMHKTDYFVLFDQTNVAISRRKKEEAKKWYFESVQNAEE